MKPLTSFHCKGKLLSLFTNIRLAWKWLLVTNTLAYNITVLAKAKKSFEKQV